MSTPGVGDTVRAGGGLTGTVEQVITGGTVYDPLTESSIVAAAADPVLVVGTKSGLRAAVAASEVEVVVGGRLASMQVGSEVTWQGSAGTVDLVVTAGEVPGVDTPTVGTKTAPAARVRLADGRRVAATLADLTAVDAPAGPAVPDSVVEAVRGRGLRSWPGPGETTLTQSMWAAARVKAFLAAVDGDQPAGYCRDRDLLPRWPGEA